MPCSQFEASFAFGEREGTVVPITLTQKAVEGSTFIITAAFFDENNSPVVPTQIKWTLMDLAGVVVNARKDVAVSNRAAQVDIPLSGNDLAVPSGKSVTRCLRVNATYNGPLGVSTPLADEVRFMITALMKVAT